MTPISCACSRARQASMVHRTASPTAMGRVRPSRARSGPSTRSMTMKYEPPGVRPSPWVPTMWGWRSPATVLASPMNRSDDPGLLQERLPQELHGDLAARVVLPRLVNLPDPARPDQAAQQEVAVREQADTRDPEPPVPPAERSSRPGRGIGRLRLELAVDLEQLGPDLFLPRGESRHDVRMRGPIAPAATHPVLLADELERQSVRGTSTRGTSRHSLPARSVHATTDPGGRPASGIPGRWR